MQIKDRPMFKFIAKNAIHFEAIMVLLMLGSIWFLFLAENNLKEEISENCGWGGEEYRCYCEKGEALAIEAKIKELTGETSFDDIIITINDTGENNDSVDS